MKRNDEIKPITPPAAQHNELYEIRYHTTLAVRAINDGVPGIEARVHRHANLSFVNGFCHAIRESGGRINGVFRIETSTHNITRSLS